jgi:hypothetical protein
VLVHRVTLILSAVLPSNYLTDHYSPEYPRACSCDVLRELQIATPGRTRKDLIRCGGRDESYRLGNGAGDGKDSRSRCPDELFVLARWGAARIIETPG